MSPNSRLLQCMFDTLGPAACDAIEACARLGYGAARDLPGILAAARDYGVNPRVVAAALGYLPSYDDQTGGAYVDALLGDETVLAVLPADRAVRTAFALSRMVYDAGCPFVVE